MNTTANGRYRHRILQYTKTTLDGPYRKKTLQHIYTTLVDVITTKRHITNFIMLAKQLSGLALTLFFLVRIGKFTHTLILRNDFTLNFLTLGKNTFLHVF